MPDSTAHFLCNNLLNRCKGCMAYSLLYSRNIASDTVIRVLDVPITDRDVMIEVLSLGSPIRRLAGYAYALRSDGFTDYERSSPRTLPFGKNRVNFSDAFPPYFLEFFPRFGVKSGIISVYLGQPDAPAPPPSDWKQFPNFNVELRLARNPGRIEYRQPIGSSVIQTKALGAINGAVWTQYLIWKKADESVWYTSLNDMAGEFVDTQESNARLMADPTSVIL